MVPLGLATFLPPTYHSFRDLIHPHSARSHVFGLTVDDFQIIYGILSTLVSIPEAPELRALGTMPMFIKPSINSVQWQTGIYPVLRARAQTRASCVLGACMSTGRHAFFSRVRRV